MKKKKRTSLVGLFNRLVRAQVNGRTLHQNRALRDEFIECGAIAADVIIDQVFAYRELPKNIQHLSNNLHKRRLHELLSILAETAESRHAQNIAQMLFWPEVTGSRYDRSLRIQIFAMIEKLRNPRVVPILRQFREEKIQETGYDLDEHGACRHGSVNFVCMLDQREIRRIISLCQ